MSSLYYERIISKFRQLRDMSRIFRKRGSHLFVFHTFVIFLAVFWLFIIFSSSYGAEIAGPEVKLRDNQINVTTSISPGEKYLEEIRKGITKELIIHIDLFRVWNLWPDEFVVGKFFIRTLKSDPVKREYIATSSDGNTLIQKRFKSFESMLEWALLIDNIKVANLRELDPGEYFIRVTVESKIRQLPPIIGYFMIFLPENEFKIRKDSPLILVSPVQ